MMYLNKFTSDDKTKLTQYCKSNAIWDDYRAMTGACGPIVAARFEVVDTKDLSIHWIWESQYVHDAKTIGRAYSVQPILVVDSSD